MAATQAQLALDQAADALELLVAEPALMQPLGRGRYKPSASLARPRNQARTLPPRHHDLSHELPQQGHPQGSSWVPCRDPMWHRASPLLPADVHTYRRWGCQDVCDEWQKPLQDELQGGAACLHVASEADTGPEAQRRQRQVRQLRPWNFFEGTTQLAAHACPGAPAGVDTGSPHLPLILALQKFLDLWQDRSTKV